MIYSIKKISCILAISISIFQLHAQVNPKEKFDAFLKTLHTNYVDKINDDEIVDVAISAILKSLDPHSKYYSKAEYADKSQAMSGAFIGIGIEYSMQNDTACITQIIPDGPAETSGLMAGDRIISIDNEVVAAKKLGNVDILKKIRGPQKTIVKLDVLRDQKMLSFNIVRNFIPDHSVQTSYMVNDSIGYIALRIFNKTTRQEIDSTIIAMNQKGMKSLILDLQNNGGGYVESALGVADEFLTRDHLVYYSVRNDERKDYYYVGGNGHFMKGKLVVLINQATASASEILTGALQDWDRAVIVGRRSFGKGLMQKPEMLFDGSIVDLTEARYYTPSGRSLQKPYKNVDYFSEVEHRFKTGEMNNAKFIPTNDSLMYNTLINKRKVYGGGGIIPDKYIPINPFEYSNWMKEVMASGLLEQGSFEYVDNQRTLLKKNFTTIEAFQEKYKVPVKIIKQVIKEASKQGYSLDKNQKEDAIKILSLEFKAQVAAQIFSGNKSYLRVINEGNESFKEGYSILMNTKSYHELITTNHKNKK
ncbi:S41 family peptidase [uncultured Bacteroides sp.]|uniref:S41 family peptidase n=1 Tax=uncultured Bacteroides sp. TaxID=162156 RepID=UPI002AAB400F|nr:S41 family peptidase [uncultured Bacteroides sp.]